MTEPSGRGQPADGQRRSQQGGGRSGGPKRGNAGPGTSWERRAAGLSSEIQRWLIRTSARNMRDEFGDQVKKAFRGPGEDQGDTWATATTEPPDAANEAPECAWCPLCRAARLIAQGRSGAQSRGGPRFSDAADTVAGAVRDAFASLDSILSYRPGDPAAPRSESPRPQPEPQRPVPPQPGPQRPGPPQPERPAPPRPDDGGPIADAPVGEPDPPAAVKPHDPSEGT